MATYNGFVAAATLVLTLVASAGCGTTTHYSGYREKVYLVEAPKKTGEHFSSANKIAFFPYLNTANFAHQLDTNLAYANQQLGEAVVRIREEVSSDFTIQTPYESQTALSEAGLTSRYADILSDYVNTGIIDERGIRDIMASLKVDILFQGVLEGYNVDSETGLFRGAAMQFIAFDRTTGRIDWNISMRVHEKIEEHTRKKTTMTSQLILGALAFATLAATAGTVYGLDDDGYTSAAVIVGSGGMALAGGLGLASLVSHEEDTRQKKVRGMNLTIREGLGIMLRHCMREILVQLRSAKLQPAPPAPPSSKPERQKRKRKRR